MLKVLSAVTALIGVSAVAMLPAKAQEWPTKQPVKLVISSPSGGLTDALARVTAEFLGKRIGQAVVVEAKPGAAGTIGAAYVANAPADGYTIFLAGAEQAISPAVRPNLAYKFEDFTFLVRPFTAQPLVLAGPNFEPKNTKEVIEYMKSNPRQASLRHYGRRRDCTHGNGDAREFRWRTRRACSLRRYRPSLH